MTLSAELQVKFKAIETGSNDLGNPEFRPTLEKILQFADGTVANRANLIWTDERTIAASSNDDLDLAGVLTRALGGTLTLAEVVGIIVVADAGNTNPVVIGGGSNPYATFLGGTTPTVRVGPGGVFVLFAPDANGLGAVTAGTADILRIANGGAGTPVTYKIAILGRSA